MKVIYVSHSTNYYGANKQLVELILEVRKTYNVNPYVICRAECEFTEVLKDNDIPYLVIPFFLWITPNSKASFKDYLKCFLNKTFFYPLISKKINFDFDLVHSNSSATDLGDYISQKKKCPHVWHVREYGIEDYNIHYILNKKRVARKYERASAVITISDSIKQYYENYISSNARYCMIYDGISVFEVADKDETFFQQEIINFCCVGLLHKNKNQYEVLKAARKLLNNGVENFNIYFVGDGDDNYIQILHSYVYENKLERNVFFTGKIKNVGVFLQGMHVGLTPSEKEAFGRVTVEYMYAGLPVICNNSGANCEIVDDGVTGYIYSLHDSAALAELMKLVIFSRNNIADMSKKCKVCAKDNFVIEITARKTFEVYQKVQL